MVLFAPAARLRVAGGPYRRPVCAQATSYRDIDEGPASPGSLLRASSSRSALVDWWIHCGIGAAGGRGEHRHCEHLGALEDAHNDNFEGDVQAQLRAVRLQRRKGLELVGQHEEVLVLHVQKFGLPNDNAALLVYSWSA